jgi:hypothetical protein
VTPEWLQRLWDIVSGAYEVPLAHRALIIALLGCSLFALGQLLTMLGTRWGDRHALAKSFFLSVLVHLCVGLGWATAIRSFPAGPTAFPSASDDPVPIRTVISDADESISPTEDTNKTAAWQQALIRAAPQMVRTEREAINQETQPTPRFEREIPAPALEALSVSTAAAEPEVQPEVTPSRPIAAPASPAASSNAEALPATELVARQEAGPIAAMPARSSLPHPAAAECRTSFPHKGVRSAPRG